MARSRQPLRPSRTSALALLIPLAVGATARADTYQPPPAETVTLYSATVLPCTITRDDFINRSVVKCKGDLLENKTLRELSILRNTIYARYGWDGYRKPWLRDYFHAQPWFKPNPKFTYKVLSDADKKNAHFIAVREQSLTERQLGARRDEILARHGKVWNDKPEWHLKNGKTVRACSEPKGVVDEEKGAYEGELEAGGGRDCRFAKETWYKPDPHFTEAALTPDEKIELGLIARSLGEFALDAEQREKSEASLDRLLKPEELRQLSLRDLRLLRNTIYARRGRPFKSQILQEHFSGLSWYKLDPGYTDKLLTATDQRNISLIRSVENEFGGPLSDEDWLTEPALDGA
ncbi:MAG TPA: YARHG domain-containing protein [Polyangia bacterium]|nr:YARHG domain-containing protein [Polyangia bacterium]